MYEITPTIYLELATLLLEQIGTRDFFSGSVTVNDGDVECRLICTVVVEHDKRNVRQIASISPVWWELRTTEGTEEFNNDFSFAEMLESINL